MSDYNGYTNYETYNICTWIINDEGLSEYACNTPFTSIEAVQGFVAEAFPEGTPDGVSSEAPNIAWDDVGETLADLFVMSTYNG